jgi:serine phosphatase RsbU (regulator of sigma subunit)
MYKAARFTLVLIGILFFCSISFAKNRYNADSLRNALRHTSQDTSRVNLLNKLAFELENSAPDSSVIFSREALKLAHQLVFQSGIASSQYALGIFLDEVGDKQKALAMEDSALAGFNRMNNEERTAAVYNVTGNIYSEESNYTMALVCYFKAQTIYNKKDNSSLSDVYNNIGLVYEEQGNFTKAGEFYFKALVIYEKVRDESGIAAAYTNLGNLYTLQSNYEKAFEFQEKALALDVKLKRDVAIALDYSNLGNLYIATRNPLKSLEYTSIARAMDKPLGLKENIGICSSNIGQALIEVYKADTALRGCSYTVLGHSRFILHSSLLDSAFFYEEEALQLSLETKSEINRIYVLKNIGAIYLLRKDLVKSLSFVREALKLAEHVGALNEKLDMSLVLANTLIANKQYELADSYFKQVIDLKDTLFGKEKGKALGKQEAEFEFDKKLLEQKNAEEKFQAVSEEQAKRQKIVIAGVSLGLAVVLIFWFLLYKRFRIAREQKLIIGEKKKEVDLAYSKLNETHSMLQVKTKEITDSINYARRIQQAILPDKQEITKDFTQSFVLFQPKDIVSGDFYWFARKGERTFLACADCTGHGVPGGFMSMIGIEKLNEALSQHSDVSDLLQAVNRNTKKAMRQSDNLESTRDGMDIALCSFDKDRKHLEYAGANRPVWIIRQENKSEIFEIKADKVAIGGFTDDAMQFTKHRMELHKGDLVYLFSDGYADQFGKKDKKLMTRQFKSILLSIQEKTMSEQEEHLRSFMEEWKGPMEQTDDILVIGIRF